jgi:diaminopimelate dehydrogenase
MKKLRIGISGYGNLGKGVEQAIAQNSDMELVAIFTRRNPAEITGTSKMDSIENLEQYKNLIDVMILCGGSSTDFPKQGLESAKWFNTVDSFDTHAKIPEYFAQMDQIAKDAGKVSLISTGWDPGLFSLSRLLGQSILPEGVDYTFWGKGVSQGHSDAIRRVAGVKDGKQYTIPLADALAQVRSGQNPELTTGQKHERICYVVPHEGADLEKITQEIKTMPHYFADYPTTVNFVDEATFARDHSGIPHGGVVIRSGITGNNTPQRIEFSLNLASNPEFTASVLVAYARAVGKFVAAGKTGALTVFDVPFAYLSPRSPEELRKELL